MGGKFLRNHKMKQIYFLFYYSALISHCIERTFFLLTLLIELSKRDFSTLSGAREASFLGV